MAEFPASGTLFPDEEKYSPDSRWPRGGILRPGRAKVNRQKPVDSHGKSANENLLLTSAPEIVSLRKVQVCSQQPTFSQNPKQGFNLLLTTHHHNL
jgi:hypothetical protein